MAMVISGDGTISGLSVGGLPDGTVAQPDLASGVAGNGPAFSAYQSSAQTLASTTFTKIQLQTEEFDTANAFDSTTNYRFTPQVAGYYQINGAFQINISATQIIVLIYKNGSAYKQGSNTGSSGSAIVSSLIYFNGSTDYVELYGYVSIGQALLSGIPYVYLNGSLVRSA